MRFSSAASTWVVTSTRSAGVRLALVHDVGLDREPAEAPGEIGLVEADQAQERVRGVAEQLQVAALVHVAVIVDPVGRDRRPVEAQGLGEVDGVDVGLAEARVVEPRRVLLEDLPGTPVVRLQALHHRDQAVVAQPLQLADRAAARLLVGLRHDLVEQLVGQLGRLQLGPGQLQGRAELGHEVAHALLAAGDAVDQEIAHERPAQPGAEADRVVELLGGRHVLVDQVQRLAPHRLHQPVGDEAVDLLADMQGPHADALVEGGGALLGLRTGPLAAADLDQRQEVDRVERVPDREPLGMRHLRLQPGRQQARGARRDDHVRPRRPVDPREQRDLQVLALRARSPGRSRRRATAASTSRVKVRPPRRPRGAMVSLA